MAKSLDEQIAFLSEYSACDVSDALLKIQKPPAGKVARGGYLADIVPYAPSSPYSPSSQPKVVAKVSTLKLVDKTDTSELPSEDSPNAVPTGSHWADETDAATILVINQPQHQTCAAIGGIMASRMKQRGLKACVVHGRVRDLAELKNSGLPVWALGQSTVGTGAEAKVHSRNVTIEINDVQISPGDILFCDPLEGVVAIPQELVDKVIDLMPSLVAADDQVKEAVVAGSAVAVAFKKFRQ